MTSKIYKTAMGKNVDMGALMLQNEHTRAVGNMGVNAAGDVIDSSNHVIAKRNQQVQKQYQRQTSSATPVAPQSPIKAEQKKPLLDPEIDFDDDPMEQPKPVKEPANGGLAQAMAKAKNKKDSDGK